MKLLARRFEADRTYMRAEYGRMQELFKAEPCPGMSSSRPADADKATDAGSTG